MESSYAGGAGSAVSTFDLGQAFQAAEKAAQLVGFAPEHFVGIGADRLYAPVAAFNLAQPLMPLDSSKMTSIGRRSRTENPISLLSGNLHQHQRVHDADEDMVVNEQLDRFDDHFDPERSVSHQFGVHERAEDWKDPRRRKTLFRRALKAAKTEEDKGGMSQDIIRAVVGVLRITVPYTLHRVLGQPQKNTVPREIQAFLYALLRRFHAIPVRSTPRRALPGSKTNI